MQFWLTASAGWLAAFPKTLLDRRTSPPSRVDRYAGGWDEVCHSLDGFGCRRARRYEIGRPAWPMHHVACSQPGARPVTRPPLASSVPPAPSPREPPSPASVPRILGRVARAMRPHTWGMRGQHAPHGARWAKAAIGKVRANACPSPPACAHPTLTLTPGTAAARGRSPSPYLELARSVSVVFFLSSIHVYARCAHHLASGATL